MIIQTIFLFYTAIFLNSQITNNITDKTGVNTHTDYVIKNDHQYEESTYFNKINIVRANQTSSAVKLDSIVIQAQNKTGQWETTSLNTFSYDSISRMKNYIYYREIKGVMVPRSKEEYDYSKENEFLSYSDYEWDMNSETWIPENKTEYTYNTRGDIEEITQSRFNTASKEMEKSNKRTFEYNSNNQLSLFFWANWDVLNKEWKSFDKREYFYNSDETLEKKLYYDWGGSDIGWFLNVKEEYLYNKDTSEVILYDWKVSLKDWQENTRKVYVKNKNNKDSITSYLDWNIDNKEWELSSVENIFYDDNQNTSVVVSFNKWDSSISNWKQRIETNYSYNTDYRYSDIPINPAGWFIPLFGVEDNICLHEIENTFDNIDNERNNSRRTMYYYTGIKTSSQDLNHRSNLKIFPNPFDDYIIVNSSSTSTKNTIEIYNLQGNRIITQNVVMNEQLFLPHLEKGIYFYKLILSGKEIRGKLIKE